MYLYSEKSATFVPADMAIMSSFKYLLVSLVVILLNENLFCNGEPGLYLGRYKAPTRKREIPIYGHQQPANYQTYPVVTSGVQPLSTYHGSYQPIANTVQQPIAYQLQPMQQGFYAQPLTSSTGFLQPAVRVVQPKQQIQYVQTKPVQQVEYVQPTQKVKYTQPAEQVEYVQPLNTGVVKPTKPQKQIFTKKIIPHVVQSKPTTQIVTTAAQPVKYTIPTEQQILSQAYYAAPATSYPQTYSIPQTSFTTYPQGHEILEAYPQGYLISQTSYPQGFPVPETSYPQVYPVPETSYPQGYPVSGTSYPGYPQGYPANNAYTDIVEGPNYIETSPKYLLQNSHSALYPYGNPNVKIYPKNYVNGEVFKLPETVDTPVGKIAVELIDVKPYRPGTEPVGNVPRVDSIESIVLPKKVLVEDKDTDENNSIETTTKSSSSSFFG